MNKRLGLAILSLILAVPSIGQETHYWTNQIGASSSLLGGAVVFGIRDNSAIFYNPGELGFIENTSLSAVGNAYFVRWLNITNGAGDNLHLKDRRLNTVPSLFSGIVKNKKNPNFSVNYAILSKQKYKISHFANIQMDYDVIESRPGLERYSGSYDYINDTREDWIGVGIGETFGKKNQWGLGGSIFISNLSQSYAKSFNATVSEDTAGINDILAITTTQETFKYSSFTVITKFGFTYQSPDWSFGATVTPPVGNINFVGKGDLYRHFTAYIPSQSDISPTGTISRQAVNTTRRTPWIFDFGAGFKWGENNLVGLRLAYFTRVKPYDLLTDSNEPDPPVAEKSGFDNMQTAHKPVINFGIGFAHRIVEGFGVLAGFHTNFSYYDGETLDREFNYVNSISYWDLYHMSLGVIWYQEKFDLNAGVVYVTGTSEDDLQQINLTDPKDFRFLQGVRNNNTFTSTGQVSLIIGFTYKFPRI